MRLGAAWAWAAAAALAIGAVLPIEDGLLGIVAILAPYLALTTVVLLPLAWAGRSRTLAVALVAVATIFVLRLGGEWWSFPPAADARDGSAASRSIEVVTWNLEAGAASGPEAMAMLNRHPVDVVMLEELTPAVVRALEADPAITARYPYRAFYPTPSVAGIGLLSVYPITAVSSALSPVRLEATLDLGGRALVVFGAHPFPAEIDRIGGIPAGLQPAVRNDDLRRIRARIDELDVQNDAVLVLGDFNTAPTEAAFGRLTSGLHDAHAEIGRGPGWTWRPGPLAFLGTGLLRIDLVLTNGGLRPLLIAMDCQTAGDHCLVAATLAFVP